MFTFLGQLKRGVIVLILSVVGFIIGNERPEMLVAIEVLDRMFSEGDIIVQQLNA